MKWIFKNNNNSLLLKGPYELSGTVRVVLEFDQVVDIRNLAPLEKDGIIHLQSYERPNKVIIFFLNITPALP